MNPSTSAASSSSSNTRIGVTTVALYTGNGKQRAEPSYQEAMVVAGDVSESSFEIVQRGYAALPGSFHSEDMGSTSTFLPSHFDSASYNEIGAAFKANTLGNELYSACDQKIHTDREECEKIADREGSLRTLKNTCQNARHTMTGLKVPPSINSVTNIGLEAAKEAHIAFLQERVQEALSIVDTIFQTVEALLQNPQKPISDLDPSIEHIVKEITQLQKSLPSPAKAFLWVVLFGVVLVPLVTLLWYSLTCLGLISITAALPQALTGIAWVVCMIAGILKSWPDYKNACAENASSGTRQLIQCHETIRSAHKDLKSKMDSSQIQAAAKNSETAARTSSFFGAHIFSRTNELLGFGSKTLEKTNEVFDKTNAIKETLDKVLADRVPSPEFLALEKTLAAKDAEIAAERAARAELQQELAKAQQEKAKLEGKLEILQSMGKLG